MSRPTRPPGPPYPDGPSSEPYPDEPYPIPGSRLRRRPHLRRRQGLLPRPRNLGLPRVRDRSSNRARVPRREIRASMAAVRRRDRNFPLPRHLRHPRRAPARPSRRCPLVTSRASRRSCRTPVTPRASRRSRRIPVTPRASRRSRRTPGADGTAGVRARASHPGRDTRRRPTAGAARPPRRRPRSTRPPRPDTSRCRCRRSSATRRRPHRVSPRSTVRRSEMTKTTAPGSSSVPSALRLPRTPADGR